MKFTYDETALICAALQHLDNEPLESIEYLEGAYGFCIDDITDAEQLINKILDKD